MKNFLLYSLAILFFACNSNDDYEMLDEIDYSEFIIDNAIETHIEFMPIETYRTSNAVENPNLQLKFNSVTIYPCYNFTFITSEFTIGNELIIRFEEVDETDICYLAVGPAIKYIDLPENTEKLVLINGSVIDQYEVLISTEKVKVKSIENQFSNILYENTFRIPENSFAYRCGTHIDNAYIYEDFLSIIEQNPNFTAFAFEGEGRIPYPTSTQGNYVNHPSVFFKYTNEEDFLALGDVLNTYSIENIEPNSGVSISLIGWNNVRFFSWIYQ